MAGTWEVSFETKLGGPGPGHFLGTLIPAFRIESDRIICSAPRLVREGVKMLQGTTIEAVNLHVEFLWCHEAQPWRDSRGMQVASKVQPPGALDSSSPSPFSP